MKIFLIYASEDRGAAERVYLALAGNKHRVFFDRASLAAGLDYNDRIRQAVLASDLVVFLISQDSVAESSYTLTELGIAQSKWAHPAGAVLPVMVRQTDYERIPNYLKAVTILEPRGDTAAEVAHEVARIAATRTTRAKIAQTLARYWPALLGVGIAALLLALAFRGSVPKGDRPMSRDEMSTALSEMRTTLRAMEAQSATIKADYDALNVSFSRLRQDQKAELNAKLQSELTTQIEDPNVASRRALEEMNGIVRDPLLSEEEKNARLISLLTSSMRDLDIGIERQAKLVETSPPSLSVDVEAMKLKRLVDKRAQMFDILRQIIDRYSQTAKGIIDTIGR